MLAFILIVFFSHVNLIQYAESTGPAAPISPTPPNTSPINPPGTGGPNQQPGSQPPAYLLEASRFVNSFQDVVQRLIQHKKYSVTSALALINGMRNNTNPYGVGAYRPDQPQAGYPGSAYYTPPNQQPAFPQGGQQGQFNGQQNPNMPGQQDQFAPRPPFFGMPNPQQNPPFNPQQNPQFTPQQNQPFNPPPFTPQPNPPFNPQQPNPQQGQQPGQQPNQPGLQPGQQPGQQTSTQPAPRPT